MSFTTEVKEELSHVDNIATLAIKRTKQFVLSLPEKPKHPAMVFLNIKVHKEQCNPIQPVW